MESLVEPRLSGEAECSFNKRLVVIAHQDKGEAWDLSAARTIIAGFPNRWLVSWLWSLTLTENRVAYCFVLSAALSDDTNLLQPNPCRNRWLGQPLHPSPWAPLL